MAVLFDTASLASRDRLDAFRTALLDASGSTRVELETPDSGVWGRMALWSFGTVADLHLQQQRPVMKRDEKAARGASPDAVAVAVHGLGQGRHRDPLRTAGRALGRPDGRGHHPALRLLLERPRVLHLGAGPHRRAGAVDGDGATRRGQPASQSALRPGQPAPRGHDARRRPAECLARRRRRSATSTTQLVRALLAGAVDGDEVDRDVLDETLLAQVHAHVRQHLRDPELGPDSVAAALAVSRRQLFRVCTSAGLSLEQLVIERRLEAAKAELAQVSGRTRTIAAVALWWGFKDPTHFSRRFRARSGCCRGNGERSQPRARRASVRATRSTKADHTRADGPSRDVPGGTIAALLTG